MISFLITVVTVSLSGVLAPGPVTAATLGAGVRRRHAGALIAIGHGLVEFPLMILIVMGMGILIRSAPVTIGIGLAGGGFLVFMGGQMLRNLESTSGPVAQYASMNPVWIGVVLTAGNPYFLIWWASVGLNLAIAARELGSTAFVLFAVVHWLCDLIWLEVLSSAGSRGSTVFGERSQRIVLIVCGVALIGFGGWFITDAIRRLVSA
ncbi:MAG: LysE family transporter [Phycisphaerae bacterium]|nr:LysE family transporter [Phycisphaerae bacterium]